MKKILIVIFVLIACCFLYPEAVKYKPYILAGIEKGEMNDAVTKVENILTENGFEILGKYSPNQEKNRIVICATHELLKKSVNKFIDKFDGLLSLAAVTRFALYKEGDNIEISYRNLPYWGNAYFRKDFPQVEKDYNVLNFKIVNMFKGLSVIKNQPFGSKKGLTIKKLRKYHFMIFMPYFDDVVVLAKKIKYDETIKRIEANFANNIGTAKKVYSMSFSGKKVTVYGCSQIHPTEGENWFLKYLDKKITKVDAYLPYEFVVMKDKIVMFSGKFFMTLAYPDFGMGTWMKLSKGNTYTGRAFKSVIFGDKKE